MPSITPFDEKLAAFQSKQAMNQKVQAVQAKQSLAQKAPTGSPHQVTWTGGAYQNVTPSVNLSGVNTAPGFNMTPQEALQLASRAKQAQAISQPAPKMPDSYRNQVMEQTSFDISIPEIERRWQEEWARSHPQPGQAQQSLPQLSASQAPRYFQSFPWMGPYASGGMSQYRQGSPWTQSGGQGRSEGYSRDGQGSTGSAFLEPEVSFLIPLQVLKNLPCCQIHFNEQIYRLVGRKQDYNNRA